MTTIEDDKTGQDMALYIGQIVCACLLPQVLVEWISYSLVGWKSSARIPSYNLQGQVIDYIAIIFVGYVVGAIMQWMAPRSYSWGRFIWIPMVLFSMFCVGWDARLFGWSGIWNNYFILVDSGSEPSMGPNMTTYPTLSSFAYGLGLRHVRAAVHGGA